MLENTNGLPAITAGVFRHHKKKRGEWREKKKKKPQEGRAGFLSSASVVSSLALFWAAKLRNRPWLGAAQSFAYWPLPSTRQVL